jgi:hypothetical protein
MKADLDLWNRAAQDSEMCLFLDGGGLKHCQGAFEALKSAHEAG